MKRTLSLFIVLILASMALFSCANAERVDELESLLAEYESRLLESHPEIGLEGAEGIETRETDLLESEWPETEESIESIINVFITFIDSGEYLQAAECYTQKVYGNLESEKKAADAIIEYCEDMNTDILSGEREEKEVKTKLDVIDRVIFNTSMTVSGYDSTVAKINASISSRAAFLAGCELEGLKNYADAILEYKKVIASDSYYNEAQEAIVRCVTTLKQSVFEKAGGLAANNEYLAAIDQLKTLNEKLQNDDEVMAKINVYEKTYIDYVIDSAAEVFVTPGTDYLKALEIINAALQHYPNHADLQTQKSYYQSYAPVYLYDTEAVRGDAHRRTTDTDIYNNTFEKCFYVGFYYDTDITYNLDNKYNTFSATIYARHKDNNGWKATVQIYADGKIVHETLNIYDNSFKPFTIELNMTGVSELRIVLDGNGNGGIGIADMIVQKTVK